MPKRKVHMPETKKLIKKGKEILGLNKVNCRHVEITLYYTPDRLYRALKLWEDVSFVGDKNLQSHDDKTWKMQSLSLNGRTGNMGSKYRNNFIEEAVCHREK